MKCIHNLQRKKRENHLMKRMTTLMEKRKDNQNQILKTNLHLKNNPNQATKRKRIKNNQHEKNQGDIVMKILGIINQAERNRKQQ